MTLTILTERRAARAPSARRESAVATEVKSALSGSRVNGQKEIRCCGEVEVLDPVFWCEEKNLVRTSLGSD